MERTPVLSPSLNSRIASAVLRFMTTRGITHHEVAEALGVSDLSLTRRLSSQTEFRVPDLDALTALFECTLTDLGGEAAAS